MTRVGWINTTGLAATLATMAAASWGPRSTAAPPHPTSIAGGPPPTSIVDATGTAVPVTPYQRIVSSSALTDRLLLELVEPDRILAWSAAGVRTSPAAFHYAGKPTVEGFGPVEAIIALKPDLVLMNSLHTEDRTAKLRAAGVAVFDLGEPRGLATLLPMIETLANLIEAPERGHAYAARFAARMKNVAAGAASAPRRRGMYLAVMGTRITGGTTGTSYHDVLKYGGLIDAAGEKFTGWPTYSAEDLLLLAPEVIVTKIGMGEGICAHPGLERLPACLTAGAIIELAPGLLDEPGPAMLEAAEEVFRRSRSSDSPG